MDAKNLKHDVYEGLTKVESLAEEIRVKLHLATLDAKKEWDEKLSPRILDAKDSASKTVAGAREKIGALVSDLEGFVQKIRGATTRTV